MVKRFARFRPAGAEGGFTLLEILVAVTILAVTFATIFRLFGGTLRSIDSSERYAGGVVLAEKIMEDILFKIDDGKVEDVEKLGGGEKLEENPDYSYEVAVSKYEQPVGRMEDEEVEEKEGDILVNTYMISVRVFWEGLKKDKKKEVKLATLKTVIEEKKQE